MGRTVGSDSRHTTVVAIDFGTHGSGYVKRAKRKGRLRKKENKRN
jgi:hypothetical protein